MQSNTSYADQTMRKFSGHIGPVYTVTWSPFASEFFLTASADWTVKLWRDKKACLPAHTAVSACACSSGCSAGTGCLHGPASVLHAWLLSWTPPSTLCSLSRSEPQTEAARAVSA